MELKEEARRLRKCGATERLTVAAVEGMIPEALRILPCSKIWQASFMNWHKQTIKNEIANTDNYGVDRLGSGKHTGKSYAWEDADGMRETIRPLREPNK
jgi:hypothetical protein